MYEDFTRIHDGENDHSYLSSTKKILGNIDPYWLENQSSERNQMSHWNGAFPCHQQFCHSLCQEMIRLHFSLPHIWIIFQIMDTAGLCIACGQVAADVQMFSPHVANTNSRVTLRPRLCRRMRVFIEVCLWVLWAATATIRLTFHLPLSFKPIVHVLKTALAKICPSPSFECYLVE